MLRRDLNLEELIALLRLAMRVDSEANGLDVTDCVSMTYGPYSVGKADLVNDEAAERLAQAKLLDVVVSYALTQLKAMQSVGYITLSSADAAIIGRARDFVAHPEADVRWRELPDAQADDLLSQKDIVSKQSIRDIQFGYAVGVLQLLLALQRRN